MRLKGPIGFKIVQLDPDAKQVREFVYNASGTPASRSAKRLPAGLALERPVDVKFGPDGALYIVDLGRVEYDKGKASVAAGTGKVLRVAATATGSATSEP